MKSSVINLIKTSQGYSIVEGDTQINKPAQIKLQKEKLYSAPKKFTQQTFTIYPYIYSKEKQNHKYLLIPAKAQWFNTNIVHQIQKKALPQWFKIRKGILANNMNQTKFEKNEDLYKKYRNYMVDLGKDSYVSALRARKGLAGDVCSIIRIHNFLEKWGLINFVHQKPKQLIKKGYNSNICTKKSQSNNEQIQKRKDCFDKDKNSLSRNYNKDDLQLIKKVTKRYRPLCHFCQGICGISWYQYKEKMFLKQLKEDNQTHTNSVNSTVSFDYHIVLCFHCFIQGNIPVILQSKDFYKASVLQKIDQKMREDNSKKKNSQFNKIAETIQKNRFNFKKTSDNLKITQQNLFNSLMTMPLQKIQKMSRIQPQTDEQQQHKHENNKQIHLNNEENNAQVFQFQNDKQKTQIKKDFKEQIQGEQKLQSVFYQNISTLELQQKECYQKFLQTWLLKIYSKLQKLQTWDKVVNWNTNRLQTIYKQSTVKKVKDIYRRFNEQKINSQSQIQEYKNKNQESQSYELNNSKNIINQQKQQNIIENRSQENESGEK